MRKFLRVVVIIGIGLIGLLLLGRLGLGVYLNSGHARQLASEQLSSLLGGNVRVTNLDAGMSSTDVQVELLAPAHGTAAPPEAILTGTVQADVSPIELAAGSNPTAVTLTNAQVTLRFDRDGNLITQLPAPQTGSTGGPLPAIAVKNATVHLIQDGRPDFNASGINATIVDNGQKLVLAGDVKDSTWGEWALSGEWARSGESGTVTLKTSDQIAVTTDELRAVPFVPAETWDWVVIQGKTPCSIQVNRGSSGEIGYRVELEPQNAHLTVPPIDLTTTDTSGRVTVENGVVTLSDVTGQVAGGRLGVASRLDFAATPSVLTFDVKASDLSIPALPQSWGLPKLDEGRLEGAADLKLVVENGKVHPWGRGEAKIVEGKLLGGDVDGTIRLVGDGERLRFQSQTAVRPPRPADRDLDTAVALLALLLQPPAPPAGSAATDDEPTYVEANLRLKDIDLEELVKRLEVKVPIRVTGRASLDVVAEIPVAQARTLKAYRIRGSITVPRLGLQDLTLDSVKADLVFRDGVLSLTDLSGRVPRPDGEPGTFAGTARYGVDPQTDLSADLKLASIPLAEVFKAVPDLTGTAAGLVSGTARLTAPGDRLGDITAYVGSGEVSSPALTVFGRKAERIALKIDVQNGLARITDATTVIEGLPVSADASLKLAGDYPYTARIKTAAASVADLKRLIPEADLPFDLTGKLETTSDLKGTLSPATVTASGSATATELVVGKARVDRLTADWTLDDTSLTLKNLNSTLYGGTIAGGGRIALKAGEASTFDVSFKDVDAVAISRAVPDTPVQLAGDVTGTLKGTIPPADKDGRSQATVALNLTAPRLRVQGIPTERLKGEVKYSPGVLAYDLTGETLGGSFELNGKYPLTDQKPQAKPANNDSMSGRIRLRGLQLGRLAEALDLAALRPLRGTVNLEANYGQNWLYGGLAGDGQLELLDLGWGDSGLREDIRTAVRITPDAIELPDLSGRFADGTLRGRVRYNLANPERSFYSATLDRADAEKILAPFGLSGLDSRISVTTRGSLGKKLRGSGTVAFERGQISGFRLAEVRVPFDWTHDPGIGGRLGVRDAGGRLFGGRLTGEATVAWGVTAHARGRLKFVGVSLRALIGQRGESSGLGSSPMNGEFTFEASEMRSLDDLTGQLYATIGEGPVYDLPIFSQFSQYVVPSVSARGLVQFDQGEIRGRLAKGLFRLQRLALTDTDSRLFADGTIGVRTGRLDLDVVATTGQVGLNAGLLRGYAVRTLAAGSVPVRLALDVSRFLSNRTVRARVTGTVDQPVVTLNLAGILTDEAVRYFLEPYLPLRQ